MRLSTDPNDPGYVDGCTALRVRVLLDGIERTRVVTADEEQRHIVRCVTDSAGRMVVDLAKQEPLKETLYGTVVIVVPEENKPLLRLLRGDVPREREARGAHHLLRADAGRAPGA